VLLERMHIIFRHQVWVDLCQTRAWLGPTATRAA